jgi:hypothetical protein
MSGYGQRQYGGYGREVAEKKASSGHGFTQMFIDIGLGFV